MPTKEYIDFVESAYDGAEPNVLYRIESAGPTYYIDLWEIYKYTKKGLWIIPKGWSLYDDKEILDQRKKFINLSWKKKYAYPTIDEAINAFRHRKLACIRHSKARIENSKSLLAHIPAIRRRAKREQLQRLDEQAQNLERRIFHAISYETK